MCGQRFIPGRTDPEEGLGLNEYVPTTFGRGCSHALEIHAVNAKILAARELESCVSLIVAVPLICIILWLDLLQRHDTLNCSSAVDGWQKGKISIYEGNKRNGASKARDPAEWEREKRFLFLIRAVTTFTSTRGGVVWVSFGCVWNPLWLKSTVAEMKGGEDAAEAKSEWKAWKWAAAQMKDELLAEWQ